MEVLYLLRFESLKKNDLIAYLVSGQVVQKSKYSPEQHTKAAVAKLFGEDDASMLPAGRIPPPGKCDEVLNVIDEGGAGARSSVTSSSV